MAVLLAEGVVGVAGMTLLLGAISKLGREPDLVRTPEALKLPSVFKTTLAVRLFGMLELLGMVGLVLVREWWSALLVAGLAVAFALAALDAMRQGLHVPCNCFGVAPANLGWPQLAAFPAWSFVASLAIWWEPHAEWSSEARWVALLAALGGAWLVVMVRVGPAWGEMASARRLAARRNAAAFGSQA